MNELEGAIVSVELYPEMNAQVVKLMRIGENPIELYAAAYIEHLTAALADMTAERDAAVRGLTSAALCENCKHSDNDECSETCGDSDSAYRWEWRGPIAENRRAAGDDDRLGNGG